MWHLLRSLSPVPQMMHHQSGTQDERVGGNTPLLDMDDALMDGPMLGHSSAIDSFFPGGLPSLEGSCTAHARCMMHHLEGDVCAYTV